MIGLLTDIHGHHQGLVAVLEEFVRLGVQEVICLGDVVDGGEANEACVVELQTRGVCCVRGNHDEYNLAGLTAGSQDFLDDLPEEIERDGILYTHICPRPKKRKIRHWTDAWNNFDDAAFSRAFVGHTHIPMIFRYPQQGDSRAYEVPFSYGQRVALEADQRYLVVVGPVGYSRDGFECVRYALFEPTQGWLSMCALDTPCLNM